MSKKQQQDVPLSLARHFMAPDDFTGSFGWMCGYSADSVFLEDAVERFTDRTSSQRGFDGQVAIALMLDPSNPQIMPQEVPGLLHLPIASKSSPFKLLHAKVAILGFRHKKGASQWCLRLIVSTGNWTMDTLSRSLDLVWTTELSSDDVKSKDDGLPQASADIAAAWEMMTWLRGLFDVRALDAKRADRSESNSAAAAKQLEDWIKKAIRYRKAATPQFFYNRKQSLLDALPEKVIAHSSDIARNYLAMGSGFYETPSESGDIPIVLTRIAEKLQQKGLLRQNPEVDVFVNPKSCQAIAGSRDAIHAQGWSIREAWQPLFFKTTELRSLHAKFLFSFNYRKNSDQCNSAWLYLGSGNLTQPGFTQPMGASVGNLEAGVVIDASSLHWDDRNLVVKPPVLPIQQITDFKDAGLELIPGDEMPDTDIQFIAPPISFLVWTTHEPGGWLTSDDVKTESIAVLDESRSPCPYDAQQGFRWVGGMPREVRVQWLADEAKHQAYVPVLDELGRLAASRMPELDLDEAWNQLANFPMPPDDEDIIAEGREVIGGAVGASHSQQSTKSRYPVRELMQLVENIASKQTSILQVDWSMWCNRLEQCLIQSKESRALTEFRDFKLNPLSPLWHAPFRPDFAIDKVTPEGKLYEEILAKIELVWKVNDFERLGVQV